MIASNERQGRKGEEEIERCGWVVEEGKGLLVVKGNTRYLISGREREKWRNEI